MGTSSSFGGPPGASPLVPTWVGADEFPPILPSEPAPDGAPPEGAETPAMPWIVPPQPPIPPRADPTRFSPARNNFSRFARSGGSDRRSLGRAVSHYVRSSTGGARAAAARMGSSSRASGRLLGFLSDVAARGADAALRTLNLEELAGRPIEEIFLGLIDYVCPDGGSVDEGIARGAFVETIVDLAGSGIGDLDSLTPDQIQLVFELFATNAIEARLCNDIGSKAITFPSDLSGVSRIETQLHDFIQRGVADALAALGVAVDTLTPDRVLDFVGGVYEEAFTLLQSMGELEAA